MRVIVGRVINGKVIVDVPLEEGATVAVVAAEEEEMFKLDEAAEVGILAALAEADRGVFVDGKELLQELRSQR